LTGLLITRAPGKPYHTLINAGDFHALQLLLYCYQGKVDVIYIDPPYNPGARDWKYNNDHVDKTDSFRHQMVIDDEKAPVMLARTLLKPEGIMVSDFGLALIGVHIPGLAGRSAWFMLQCIRRIVRRARCKARFGIMCWPGLRFSRMN
jgi:hypothetical protein